MGSHCLNLLSRATAELEQSEESRPTPPVMFRVVLVSCLAAAACGQSLESKDAKILKEQRFAAGDGRFGSAFAQEDGTVFREETTADGERIGQYSYIDENGETITVRYTAGKDGFRILEGAHIPEGANGLQSAPFDPEIAQGQPQSPPAEPQAAPVREQPRPVRPVRRRPVRPAQQQQQPPQVPSGDFNPFINPADPSHLDFQTNINAAQFRPRQPAQEIPRQRQQVQTAPVQRQQFQPAPVRRQQFQPARVQRQQFQPAPVQRQQFQPAPVQRQQSSLPSAASVPACANCAGVNPFINPADSSFAQLFSAQQPAAQPAFQPQPPQQQQQPTPAFQFQQRSQQAQQQPLQPAFATPTFRQPQQTFRQPAQTQPTTLNHFQGQLSLNRFHTGFNFDFSS